MRTLRGVDRPETEPAERHSDSRQGIQSVELAMTVLQALERGLGPMTLTQIATAAGMGASKAHRYLVSLCRIGLVAQEHRSGQYDLGPGMRRLGIEALRRVDEAGVAADYMPGLRDRTSHAVNLAAWGDAGPVIIRWISGGHALPITLRVGSTMPLLTSSLGQVYLAYLPGSMTIPVLEEQLTQKGQAKPSTAELETIRTNVRARGAAVTSHGVIAGVASIAAPIFPGTESIPLALAMVFPVRTTEDQKLMSELEAELLRTTAEISEELGGTPPVS